jgi:hypothetical protein
MGQEDERERATRDAQRTDETRIDPGQRSAANQLQYAAAGRNRGGSRDRGRRLAARRAPDRRRGRASGFSYGDAPDGAESTCSVDGQGFSMGKAIRSSWRIAICGTTRAASMSNRSMHPTTPVDAAFSTGASS